jgi:hypothetical protein
MADLTAMLQAAAGAGGEYQISRSLRFNSADSAYLSRTPASEGNRKTWTYSFWTKISKIDARNMLFEVYAGASDTDYIGLEFGINNRLTLGGGLTTWRQSTQVFRDLASFYHIVIAVDTTQATPANRIKVYVNGVEITAWSINGNPTQNADTAINSTSSHKIGNGTGGYYNGYLADINFVDGQALTPSSFGETNETTGVWSPIRYAGSYGTNGFYLNFSNNSGVTSTTLGKDRAGSNNWTPNNFSVTAGAGNDSLVDTPTQYGTDTGAGGEVRGNYCTLNPLSTTTGTYSQGNLRFVGASDGRQSLGTISVSTGKWYWEVTLASAPYSPRAGNTDWTIFGFCLATTFNGTYDISNGTNAIALADNGYYKNFANAQVDGGTAFLSGDTLAIAVDLDANTFTFYRNNTQLATGTIGGTAGRELVPFQSTYTSAYALVDCNFGQRPFAYTAPSGFKALVTTNLPEPTVVQGDDYFNTVLYTGNGYPNAGTQTITGLDFQPDFIWIKSRSTDGASHTLTDAVRGTTKTLFSNTANAEETVNDAITSFNSDGFSLGDNSEGTLTYVNVDGATFVGWNWKANGAGVSNTAGTITSTVSANTTAGISIVTYTGTGSAATVGHGLGVAVDILLVKRRDSTAHWGMWNRNITSGNGKYIYLSLPNPLSGPSGSAVWDSTNTTTQSSTATFDIGVNPLTNASGGTYVAYCFAEVEGFSKFGSYTGNGSADGPFVYTGFRPAWVLIKDAIGAGAGNNWYVYDSKRNTYNLTNLKLYPNLSAAENGASGDTSSTNTLDILSNGFKLRTSNSATNASAIGFIYAAFAENPFKYSLAR